MLIEKKIVTLISAKNWMVNTKQNYTNRKYSTCEKTTYNTYFC